MNIAPPKRRILTPLARFHDHIMQDSRRSHLFIHDSLGLQTHLALINPLGNLNAELIHHLPPTRHYFWTPLHQKCSTDMQTLILEAHIRSRARITRRQEQRA